MKINLKLHKLNQRNNWILYDNMKEHKSNNLNQDNENYNENINNNNKINKNLKYNNIENNNKLKINYPNIYQS